MEEDQFTSLSEAAALSGLSAGHLRHMAEKGRLRAKKIGRNWITTKTAIAEYMENPEMRSKDPYKHKRT